MKIEVKIHANCSEWDEIIEPEDSWMSEEIERQIKEAKRQAKYELKTSWDV